MAKERWKEIPGFSWYEISTQGRVRTYKGVNQNSPPRKRPVLMKIRVGDDAYPRVTMQSDSGKKLVRRVHLLVAAAFLGPARGRLVRHKNGDPGDPRLSNLKYGSHKQNSKDKYAHGTDGRGEGNSQAILTEEEVIDIYENPDGWYQQELADYYGISRQAVSDIQNGVTWTEITGS